MKRVCYVLAYRAPDYIRSRSIIAALSALDDIELQIVINRNPGFNRYFDTLRRLLALDRRTKQDIFILGFRGHEIYWPVRWIARKRPIIFDALMSPYAALAEELKFGRAGLAFSMLWRGLEAGILRNADAVLTDTPLHATYFQESFTLDKSVIYPIPVGAITPSRPPKPVDHRDEFTVLFYGSFLPLHGVETIIEAASQLRDLPIRFNFVGGSLSDARNLRTLCAKNRVANYSHTSWVPFDQLLTDWIPRATLCLGGPFGDTPQARRVVTGKTSQCLALASPTIVGRIEGDYGFADKQNCLLVEQGNAESLTNSLRWCYRNKEMLPAIGKAGQRLYEETLSVSVIRDRLRSLITHI